MSRKTRWFAIALLLMATPITWADAGPLDLIPSDAGAAFAIRNLKELREKGDKFLEESGWKVGIRPSELFQQVYDHVGLKAGLDENAPAAIYLANPTALGVKPDLFSLQKLIVLVLPFKEIDDVGSNYGLKKGELKTEKIQKLEHARAGQFGYIRGKHLYLCDDQDTLRYILKIKPASEMLSAERRKILEKDDMTLLIGTNVWGDDYQSTIKQLERHWAPVFQKDPQMGKGFVKALENLQYVVVGARLEDGLGMRFLAAFPKEMPAEAVGFLETLQAGDGTSNLKGLPTGRVVAAHAAQTDGGINAKLARTLLEQFILPQPGVSNPIFAASDKTLFTGVFTELWRNIKGRKLAVYQNADEAKQGSFTIAAILDPDDPKTFLDEIAALAKFAEGKDLDLSGKTPDDVKTIEKLIRDLGDDNYRTRENASIKLNLIGEPALPHLLKHVKDEDLEVVKRVGALVADIKARTDDRRKELAKDGPKSIHPGFVLARAAETIDGQKVDIVHVKLATEEVHEAGVMKSLFGPEWNKIRMAVIGKQVVVLIGTDVELFKQTIKNVKTGAPGLAADNRIAGFLRQGDSARKFELHANVATFDDLTNGAALDLSKIKARSSLSSASFSVAKDRIEANLFVPMAELKELVKRRGF